MSRTESTHLTRSALALAGLATLALALAACSGASPSPTASSSPSGPSAPSPSPTLLTVSPAAAPEPQTIHLILSAVNDSVGSLKGCPSAGSCQGDFMIGYDPLVDAATGKEVGTFAYECFLVDVGSTLYHCPGVTITLAGRGQIVFTEVIEHESGKPPAIAPIIGGTGEFLGATGVVTASVLSAAGDFVITIDR